MANNKLIPKLKRIKQFHSKGEFGMGVIALNTTKTIVSFVW